MRLQLLFPAGPSPTVRSGVGYSFTFALGQPMRLAAYGAPGDVFVHAIDFGGRGFAPLPLALPPLSAAARVQAPRAG